MTDKANRDRGLTRRDVIGRTLLLAGSVAVGKLFPDVLFAQQPAATANPIDQMRAQMGAAPIEVVKLSDTLTMLSGPGGNVVVLNGPDGKVVVDCFVQPVWPKL